MIQHGIVIMLFCPTRTSVTISAVTRRNLPIVRSAHYSTIHDESPHEQWHSDSVFLFVSTDQQQRACVTMDGIAQHVIVNGNTRPKRGQRHKTQPAAPANGAKTLSLAYYCETAA